MPRHQPFTVLCQEAARAPSSGRADLHVHTTSSDGAYTPAEVVDLARRVGLAAVAVTDHDTLDGVAPARAAARGRLEVIAGVEITAECGGREVHLLGYFVRPNDRTLRAALDRLRDRRRGRFSEMVERLRARGLSVEEEAIAGLGPTTALGRRNLAQLLHDSGQVGSVREAFARYLADDGPVNLPKERLPLADAVALVRSAGGVTSLAHPSADLTLSGLATLRDLGLQAVEAAYPSFRAARVKELRAWAVALDLMVTGGSDCHGPGAPARAVGACGVTAEELAVLRASAAAVRL
jgi:predicted metal-dependent phosphoesterase TrpH